MPGQRTKFFIGIIVGLAAIALVLLLRIGMTWPSSAWRDTNRYEVFYHRVAYLANEPGLCDRISLNAVRSGGFNPPGKQIQYVRSQCYHDVAVQHHRPELCDRIKPLSTPFMTGYNLSPSACREAIKKSKAESSRDNFNGYLVGDDDYIGIFTEMGYEPDTIHLEFPVGNVINKREEYRKLGKQPDIVQRLQAIIKNRQAWGTKQPVHDIDREILVDMLATLTNDTKTCRLIRPDTFIPESGSGEKSTFRNWCIFKIAARTARIELCEEITNRVPDLEFPWESMKNSCRSQIKSHPVPAPRYYYFIPKKELVMDRLTHILGYRFSRPATAPADKIANKYRDVIYNLKRHPELKRDSQYQRLLGKIRELPGSAD